MDVLHLKAQASILGLWALLFAPSTISNQAWGMT